MSKVATEPRALAPATASPTGWTPERVERLRTLWSAGHSASQIADRLGGVTRSAVLGKIMRLGLQRRNRASRRPDRPKTEKGSDRRGAPPSAARCPEPLPARGNTPSGARDAILALEPESCRWAFGDPRHSDFQFCGRRRRPGSSYCQEHHRQAHTASEPLTPFKRRTFSRYVHHHSFEAA